MKETKCGKCGCNLDKEHFEGKEEVNLIVDTDETGMITNVEFWCAACTSGEGING